VIALCVIVCVCAYKGEAAVVLDSQTMSGDYAYCTHLVLMGGKRYTTVP